MGSSTSREDSSDNEEEDWIEVYLLMKELGSDKYTSNVIVSHHTCLFKCKDGSFYYTDLDVNNKGGPCQLHFGKYKFLTMPIFYKPVGRTRKSLSDIVEWIKQHKTAGTSYTLVFNDCQVYARQCIRYLNVFDVPSTPPGIVLVKSMLPGFNRLATDHLVDHTLNIRCAASPAEICLS